MTALVLNGSRSEADMTDRVYNVVLDTLAEAGLESEAFVLRDTRIAHCLGCFGCWVKTPGICVIDDEGREVARAAVGKDPLIFLTPVTFGGYSSELKKALDRAIPLVTPFFTWVDGEIHHQKRYDWTPRIVAIGVLSEDDDESRRIFSGMVHRNAVNFHSPGSAVGFVTRDTSEQDVSAVVRKLLAEVGVSK